ncbi:sensor histidine kinase [Formosimonas limnophila]|uniref:sensor histidine kinase n=1 Tax=Formosimonas limnophila TaxID=1384487 RepID=UPI00167A67E0|nr:hypothetical protein [Formosimonas limnophila]
MFYSQIVDKVHQTLDWAVDLVDLSKVKVNQYQMNELNATQILDEAVEHVWSQVQAKRIELTFDEADRLAATSIWVLCDGALLIRALDNLLSNAIRYSESDSVVRVAVCTEGSNPQWVHLSYY